MKTELEALIAKFNELGVARQLDYDKFYLYSIITHSTAIEGSTITELENQIMFDNGIALKGKSLIEQNMNLDLKSAYGRMLEFANAHADITIERLKQLSALTMKNTGTEYHTVLGDFSSANGDLRLLNVSAGAGGRSYMAYNKVPLKLKEFCDALNHSRRNSTSMTLLQLYEMSFDAHYELVTIHPWADGNGRMARLLMNWLQFEYGLVPSRILSEDKEDYIKSLVATRESGDLSIFRKFMTGIMIEQLSRDIAAYEDSIGPEDTKAMPTRDKVLAKLRKTPGISAAAIAREIGMSTQGVQRHLAKLKADGVIRRIGPDKGGHWEVIMKNPD